jgi:hypothetical protein
MQDKLFNYKLKSDVALTKHFLKLDEIIRDLIACGNGVKRQKCGIY